jgi:hypothetical protein
MLSFEVKGFSLQFQPELSLNSHHRGVKVSKTSRGMAKRKTETKVAVIHVYAVSSCLIVPYTVQNLEIQLSGRNPAATKRADNNTTQGTENANAHKCVPNR